MIDAAYNAWIQTLPSIFDGRSYSEWLPEIGEWRNPACHVRRAGRSGIAYREPFAQIPLTHEQHRVQHSSGELSCLVRFTRDPRIKSALRAASTDEALRIAEEFFDGQVQKYREIWRQRTGTAPWDTTEHANA